MHDFNGGVQPSGLFWVVELPQGAIHVSGNGKHASMRGDDVAVIDSFQFGGPNAAPASVSFSVDWDATGPTTHVQSSALSPFSAEFAPAFAKGRFSGRELGFSFVSNPGANTSRGFAEMGRERNGRFL